MDKNQSKKEKDERLENVVEALENLCGAFCIEYPDQPDMEYIRYMAERVVEIMAGRESFSDGAFCKSDE